MNMVLNNKSKTTQIAALEFDGSLISDSKRIAESMNNFVSNFDILSHILISKKHLTQ